jgi:putative FmdB family regulatory protein
MPQYDYRCKDCQELFMVQAGMNDKRDDVKCPSCESQQVNRVFGSVVLAGLPTRGAKQ